MQMYLDSRFSSRYTSHRPLSVVGLPHTALLIASDWRHVLADLQRTGSSIIQQVQQVRPWPWMTVDPSYPTSIHPSIHQLCLSFSAYLLHTAAYLCRSLLQGKSRLLLRDPVAPPVLSLLPSI